MFGMLLVFLIGNFATDWLEFKKQKFIEDYIILNSFWFESFTNYSIQNCSDLKWFIKSVHDWLKRNLVDSRIDAKCQNSDSRPPFWRNR